MKAASRQTVQLSPRPAAAQRPPKRRRLSRHPSNLQARPTFHWHALPDDLVTNITDRLALPCLHSLLLSAVSSTCPRLHARLRFLFRTRAHAVRDIRAVMDSFDRHLTFALQRHLSRGPCCLCGATTSGPCASLLTATDFMPHNHAVCLSHVSSYAIRPCTLRTSFLELGSDVGIEEARSPPLSIYSSTLSKPARNQRGLNDAAQSEYAYHSAPDQLWPAPTAFCARDTLHLSFISAAACRRIHRDMPALRQLSLAHKPCNLHRGCRSRAIHSWPKLTSLPDQFAHLAYLRQLDLSGHYFNAIPAPVLQLRGLQRLYMNHNPGLVDVPSDLGDRVLPRLTVFHAMYTALTTLPNSLFQCMERRLRDMQSRCCSACIQVTKGRMPPGFVDRQVPRRKYPYLRHNLELFGILPPPTHWVPYLA